MLPFIKNRVIFFLLILLLSMVGKDGFGQKEANNWFFVGTNALTFNYGPPQNISCPNYLGDRGTAVASDSAGNLLFYTNGVKVWTRTHQLMQNGYGLSGEAYYQSCVAFRKPGSFRYYYIFTNGNYSFPPNAGLRFSLVDMDANGGEGAVVQKNIALGGGGDAMDVVTATLHKNNRDVWVITRVQLFEKYIYAAYLVTPTGISLPIYTDNYKLRPGMTFSIGGIKVSPNGKKFMDFQGADDFLGDFDNTTGTLTKICNSRVTIPGFITIGGEFSNDSRYFYYCGTLGNTDYTVYQFDATAPDSLSFVNSAVLVGSVHQTVGTSDGQFMWMQAAPDGKVYGVRLGLNKLFTINYPDEYGANCGFQLDGYQLNNNAIRSLPQFVSSYTQHVYYTGSCAGTAFQFTANFQPTPVSILWDFGDGGTSNLMNPTHVYTYAGTYEVVAYVVYPDGKTGEAHREVLVNGMPHPNLGPDLTVCQGTIVTLSPPGSFSFCTWSTGSHSATISVSDTGSYWVQVVNDTGCMNSDTIHVGWYTKPAIDESNLNLAPTTCGGTTGAITGLKIIGQAPYTYQWKASGTPFSDSLDIYHLGAGLYELSVTDGYGCSNTLASYAISDAGNILIDTAFGTPAYCGNHDGTLTITAISGLGSMLKYFIKTGSDTLSQWSDGAFTGLAGGTYYVWVSDSSGCKSVYPVPLVLDQLNAPIITSVTSTPETGTASDGSITVTATGIGLTYSLNGAAAVGSGYFTGLSKGNYTITVANSFGCDTTFTVTVGNTTLIHLTAIAGDGSACLGNVAVLPLQANSFRHVSSFKSQLKYDSTLVSCQNYLNVNPALADSLQVDLFPLTGELRISWTGKTPVNLQDGSTLVELSFASLNAGQDSLKWDISPGICIFIDSLGNSINHELIQGQVRVYSIPKAEVPEPLPTCEGGDVLLIANYQAGTGNGTISYNWTGSGGFTSNEPLLTLTSLTQAEAGQYIVSVSDTNHCQSDYTAEVSVIPTPVAGFTADTIYFDEQVQLEAGQGYYKYAWNTGDSTYSVLVSAEGWYKVSIETVEGCNTTDSVMMLYAFVPLNMPNAFTPDGDGLNDYFKPVTLPEKIGSFSMYIYDRWGMQVFFTNDVRQGWDGTINGNPAPIGGHIYVVKYGNPSGAVREKRGMVMVVR